MNGCIFCDIRTKEKRVLENQFFYAIFDKYPVNPGHLLIISKAHIPNLFGLDEIKFIHLSSIIKQAKKILDKDYEPEGYNIGANCGEMAGQTIFHFHLHIIPRFKNDIDNPRGGIRNMKEPIVPYLEKQGIMQSSNTQLVESANRLLE